MDRVAVIGCGLMGAGIVEVCAASGAQVVVLEVDASAIEAGRARLASSTERSLQRGRYDEEAFTALHERVSFTTDIDELADRELVIEAALEDLGIKTELFATLDRIVVDERALFATNTSSIPISRIARATDRPEQVLGLHFFNPVPMMPLVEVVRGLRTSDDTAARGVRFAREQLAKTVIECGDRAGFVVNILLVPYLLSAIRLLETGFASAEDIDLGMVTGGGHPAGPLSVADFIGLDTLLDVSRVLYDEFLDPSYAPPPLLVRMVDAGMLGRKAGHGLLGPY